MVGAPAVGVTLHLELLECGVSRAQEWNGSVLLTSVLLHKQGEVLMDSDLGE
jgi:hypothetical protein